MRKRRLEKRGEKGRGVAASKRRGEGDMRKGEGLGVGG